MVNLSLSDQADGSIRSPIRAGVDMMAADVGDSASNGCVIHLYDTRSNRRGLYGRRGFDDIDPLWALRLC